MTNLSTPTRAVRTVVAALCLIAVQFTTAAAPAHADRPTVINEDNTGFACEYFPEGAPQVSVSINFDAVTQEGYSFTDVLSPDGELDVANGYTEDVQVGNGVVSARYRLLHPDGSTAGEVVLDGTYVAAGETLSLRSRNPYAQNAKILGTLEYTPLAVTWKTFQVGDYDVSGINCEGQRSKTSNRVLEPHRLVSTFSELRLLGNCAAEPLTEFSVVGSEAGVSIVIGVDGYQGFTNLDLEDGSDTQSVEWYAEGGEEPAEITSITATAIETGHRRSVARASSDGLILERIQPLTFSYKLALPGGAGTVATACPAEAVAARFVVEPVI